jgi:hypothetical protein
MLKYFGGMDIRTLVFEEVVAISNRNIRQLRNVMNGFDRFEFSWNRKKRL